MKDGETEEELDARVRHLALEEPIMKYFAFAHLPPHLRLISRDVAHLAREMMLLPRSAERAAGLRKLLEAKDCFVRAGLP